MRHPTTATSPDYEGHPSERSQSTVQISDPGRFTARRGQALAIAQSRPDFSGDVLLEP
jgi:hypothetical protein